MWKARLDEAAQACRAALEVGPLSEVVPLLGSAGEPQAAFQLLSHSRGEVSRLLKALPQKENTNLERAVLVLASLWAIPLAADLPVSDRVKELFAEEFLFFANPPPIWTPRFRATDVRFHEMARIATFRRFPAGQFHWEASAFPRSWLRKASPVWPALRHVVFHMRGFGPLFEAHVNERRKNRIAFLEKEANYSYYRIARSMAKQPAVKGLMTSSWMFSESTALVTPRLAWLRGIPQAGGAQILDLGPAPENSGFLVGSEERRQLYKEGKYRPTVGCVLWDRKSLLAWADQHSEFDS